MNFGNLHFQVLHFPIALLLSAALAELIYLVSRRGVFHAAGGYCIVLAGLMAIPTAVSGDWLADNLTEGPAGKVIPLLPAHCTMGLVTLGLALAAAAVRLWRWKGMSRPWAWVYGLLLLAGVVMVTLTAHWGGMIVFGADYLR